jgi:YVTN family beta-propeller protein
VSPDGGEVWVVNRSAGSISIVDTAALEVVATLEAPPFAGRAEISPDGRVLVPNGSSGEDVELYLTLYDLATRQPAVQHAVRPGETGPGGFGIHIAGEIAFVSDRAAREIAVYDLEQFPASRILAMGHDGPDGLAYSPLRLELLND